MDLYVRLVIYLWQLLHSYQKRFVRVSAIRADHYQANLSWGSAFAMEYYLHI